MTKRRNPYVPIYPGDWLQGPVAGCSLAAQGLWLRLKFIMHGCEPYGYLYPGRRRVTAETNAASQADVTPMSRSSHADVTPMSRTMSRTCHADVTRDTFTELAAMEVDVGTGTAPSTDRVARMCGVPVLEYLEIMAELEAAGVPRYTASGVMYDEEMVDEASRREQWRLRQGYHRTSAEKNAGSHEEIMAASNGLSRRCHADVTPMSRTMSRTCHADVTPSSCSSSKSKERTPLPPAGAGGNLMRWDGREGFREDIFVDMGKARRVITEAEKTALGGSPRQEDVLQLFRNKGFKAETKSTLEAALARPIVCKNDLYEAWLALDVKQFGKAHGS